MQVNLKQDGCKYSLFWEEWIRGGVSAVIDLTQFNGFDEYFASITPTKRNDCRKSMKRGYYSKEITREERNTYLDDIYKIHTSKEQRQGRSMGQAYQDKVQPIIEFLCQEHSGLFFGCFYPYQDNRGQYYPRLVSYILVSQMGEAWFLSMIIGHGDYLKDFVMVNVLMEVVRVAFERGVKCIGYHRWDNGTKGLQFWKRSVGFKPIQLTQ